jgi:hypothetical protein
MLLALSCPPPSKEKEGFTMTHVNILIVVLAIVACTFLVAMCIRMVFGPTSSIVTEGYLDPEKMFVIQGVGLPEEVKISKIDTQDPNLPSIDGGRDSKRAMFMFAFNESGPQCCPSVLSTTNGCVCVTPEQNAFIANGGISKQRSVLH